MATKKVVAPKRSVKKTVSVPEVSLPPLVFSTKINKTKKTVAKKTVTKSVTKKSAKKPEVIVVEEVNLGTDESLKLPADVKTEYIVVHRCTNCEHIPFSLTKLVTLFSILIMLLSVSVLIQVGTIDLGKLIVFVSPVAQAASQILPR